MIEYTVRVYDGVDEYWYLNNDLRRIEGAGGYKAYFLKSQLHREEGPAVVNADGTEEYWLNGKQVTEEEHKKLTSKAPCQGKVVVIDGIEYRLEENTP